MEIEPSKLEGGETPPAPIVETPPTPPTPSLEEGGNVIDSSAKLGLIPLMMLGLVTASLVYSIYYYRNALRDIKKGSSVAKVREDVDALRNRLDNLTKKKTRNNGRN
jgi:hypothetical protein